jgi:histidyl-tRNA synthetase
MNRGLKANFKQADRLKVKFAIIIGEEEAKNKVLTIKNNYSHEEYKIDDIYIVNFLDEKVEDIHED